MVNPLRRHLLFSSQNLCPAQHQELAVDSGRAPERVGERHLLDEGSQLRAHRRTPWPTMSRLSGPESAEPLPMPADDGLWPNQAQGIAPARPALRKPDPEDPGDSSELRPLGALAQEGQLLPKREILERQMAARFQGGADRAQQSEQGGPHEQGSLVPPQVPVKSGDRDLAKHNLATYRDKGQEFLDRYEMSWIYHDSELEGVVYSSRELNAALHGGATKPTEASMMPLILEIRNHKSVVEYVREEARSGTKKSAQITLTEIKRMHDLFSGNTPEALAARALMERREKTEKELAKEEEKGGYRFKDMPLHRAYFHDIAPSVRIPALF